LNGERHKGKLYYYDSYYTSEHVIIHELIFEGEFFQGKPWNRKGTKDNYIGEFLNGEKNGKGKEFLNGTIIFDGEYQNGKRKNGKEYYYENGNEGKLKYEGEYLFGEKWNGQGYNAKGELSLEIKNGKGKMIQYYKNGKIKFEGEYINGERNGKGKEYYDNGELKFEGDYINGKKNGKCKEYYNNGKLKFEGEYLNGERNGKGKEYDF